MGQKINKVSVTEEDLEVLSKLSGKPKEEISLWSEHFFRETPSGKLDREQFVKYYKQFRKDENCEAVAKHCFNAFDLDRNDYVDFGEFLISYVATTNGDIKEKLNYAFNVYDQDNNKVLDESEIRIVLKAMFILLNINTENVDLDTCLENIMKSLDGNHDTKISKAEFIDGILTDSVLQTLLSPFPLNLQE